jgi:hypothetical protein
MPTHRDPTRRSRRIGAPGRGRGQDNRMVIPEPREAGYVKAYWKRLGDHRVVERNIRGQPVTFVVERTARGSVHACTVDDVARVLSLAPRDDLAGLAMVVLRQPTRKQHSLAPHWGRYTYYATVSAHTGPVIFLDAGPPTGPLRWPRRATPDDAAEIARLRADGHAYVPTRREHVFELTLASIRVTQLYRTLLHELGHHVDYRRALDGAEGAERAARTTRYWARPVREREAFAHRYADELRAALFARGALPFERLADPKAIAASGLDPADFVPRE